MAENTVAVAESLTTAECPSVNAQVEELYSSYHDAIYRYLYRLVGRADLAGDLTQDVFMQLQRQLRSKLRLQNPKAWLYTVATNLGYNQLRRERRLVNLFRCWMPLIKRTMTPEQMYEQVEQCRLAHQAVSRLPVREQILLQLFQDDLSYSEIASALNLNPASVGKLLARAIEKCARSVEK